ncbi:hypothetical protein [Providencia sp. PROV147]|uniref:hypothetical protein n=1 Tax=Providencia sp. PROV147 TaxID=2949857 RepID=UPI00234A0DB7|nr:hypothetical protein [Providencia sp. PROV147]
MKIIGYMLVVVGVLLLGFSFLMNTTSYTDGLGRVNDLSLLFSQQNRIIVFCFIILYGVILISKESKLDSKKETLGKMQVNEIKNIGFKSAVISNINNYRSYDFLKNGKLDESRLSSFLIICNELIIEAKNNGLSMDKIESIMNEIIINITEGLNESDTSIIKIEIKKLIQ